MTDRDPRTTDEQREEPPANPEEPLDELDAEVVEDLDVDEDADDVHGGTRVNTVACWPG